MNHYLYAIVDRMPTAWRPPTGGLGDASLAIHPDIVATLIDAAALVPFRYGTVVPATGLAEWVSGHHAVVGAALGSVRDCVEMSVKLLRLDCAVEGRERRGAEPGPGARELQGLADALVERAGLPQWRFRPTGSSGNVAASIAFLVPRAGLADFLARIAPVATRATGVAVVPTGPWPPYSFVPDFERAPLARVPAEGRAGAVDRRAG